VQTTTATKIVSFPAADVGLLEAFLVGLPSASTRKVYRQAIRAFDDFVGEQDLLHVTRRDIEAYRSHLENLGRSPSTIAKIMSALVGYYGRFPASEPPAPATPWMAVASLASPPKT